MCLVVAFFLVVSLFRLCHAIIIDHEIQWLSALPKQVSVKYLSCNSLANAMYSAIPSTHPYHCIITDDNCPVDCNFGTICHSKNFPLKHHTY